VLVLEHGSLDWVVRWQVVVRVVQLIARLRLSGCRLGMLWVERHLISRERMVEAVVLHELAPAWAPASTGWRLVSEEVKPVQRETV
jgi:hypothetical protein